MNGSFLFVFLLCSSAMAVESVTVVAPEVRVGPFLLSKGIPLKNRLKPCVPPSCSGITSISTVSKPMAFQLHRTCGADQ